jgi:ribosome biogenesis SPOUT family RNA methylase Rps3
VQLTGITDDDTFTVWSPVLDLPVQNQVELMEKLMQMNWLTTFESRFAIFNNQIVVVATRAVANLSPEEISRSITIVATIADDYDEALLAEFPAAAA